MQRRTRNYEVGFPRAVADCIQEWKLCSNFTLSIQTGGAIVGTLREQSSLIEDLLEKGYHYVMTDRFQNDPLERRFRPNRQMNNDNFLVSYSGSLQFRKYAVTPEHNERGSQLLKIWESVLSILKVV